MLLAPPTQESSIKIAPTPPPPPPQKKKKTHLKNLTNLRHTEFTALM